jgi:hypothetical protein
MGLRKDVRFVLRTLAGNPSFTVIAITALSLGIGVNAIMFTITNAMLFKGMPFDKDNRVLYLATRYPKNNDWINGISICFRVFRRHLREVGIRSCEHANIDALE